MGRYIARRLLLAVPTVLGAALLIFLIMRIIPGDVAVMLAGGGEEAAAHPEKVEAVREALGLNEPLHIQFTRWMGDFFQGRWGESLWTKQPIQELLGRRYPLTLELAALAVLLSWLIAVPAGTVSAVRQDTWLDYVPRFLSIIGLAIPNFWLGMLVIMFLVSTLGWFPELTYTPPWQDPLRNFSQLVFPALVVGTAQAAVTSRMMRSSLLDVLREDYIRTARAKGLPSSLVLNRHAMRNALIPVITLAGVQLGTLISGSVVTEVVFNLPGLGQALVDSVNTRDYPVVQTLVLMFTLGFILLNLLVDILYSWLNPRVRYG